MLIFLQFDLIYLSVLILFWWSLDDFVYIVCLLQLVTILLLYQFGYLLFIYFLLLSAAARTSVTVLNKSSKNGHPCLVPVLRGKVFHY